MTIEFSTGITPGKKTIDAVKSATPNLQPELLIASLKQSYAHDIALVAPDLNSFNLAERYTEGLFQHISALHATTEQQIIAAGIQTYYSVGKNVLGPLAVHFVHDALKQSEGFAIFPARDATPLYHIAKTLKSLKPDWYPVDSTYIVNPVFNRKLWGIEDEQDPESAVLPIEHQHVQKLLAQMGFFSSKPKTFIEIGCWGSMIDQLKNAMQKGKMPIEECSVHFLYTHLPQYIFGFMNTHANGVAESDLEAIADTWEAFPKTYKRPTVLVETDGYVHASLEGKIVPSPLLLAWSNAATEGVIDAAKDFALQGVSVDPSLEIQRLQALSHTAQSGVFTGLLPEHTETWSEGNSWIQNWQWGKIPPQK